MSFFTPLPRDVMAELSEYAEIEVTTEKCSICRDAGILIVINKLCPGCEEEHVCGICPNVDLCALESNPNIRIWSQYERCAVCYGKVWITSHRFILYRYLLS
jgi:hypothetical protein